MPVFDRSFLVAAPVRQVFDYVAEPRNTMRYQKQFTSFEVADNTPRGVGMEVDARGRFHGIPVRTRLRMVDFVQDELIASQSVSGLKNSSQWRFTPGAGGTQVRFTARYEWPLPILSRRLRTRIEEELASMTDDSLRTLKALIESSPVGSAVEVPASPAGPGLSGFPSL